MFNYIDNCTNTGEFYNFPSIYMIPETIAFCVIIFINFLIFPPNLPFLGPNKYKETIYYADQELKTRKIGNIVMSFSPGFNTSATMTTIV